MECVREVRAPRHADVQEMDSVDKVSEKPDLDDRTRSVLLDDQTVKRAVSRGVKLLDTAGCPSHIAPRRSGRRSLRFSIASRTAGSSFR